jgi:hypothetical protein
LFHDKLLRQIWLSAVDSGNFHRFFRLKIALSRETKITNFGDHAAIQKNIARFYVTMNQRLLGRMQKMKAPTKLNKIIKTDHQVFIDIFSILFLLYLIEFIFYILFSKQMDPEIQELNYDFNIQSFAVQSNIPRLKTVGKSSFICYKLGLTDFSNSQLIVE